MGNCTQVADGRNTAGDAGRGKVVTCPRLGGRDRVSVRCVWRVDGGLYTGSGWEEHGG